jgi:hypothetical protein
MLMVQDHSSWLIAMLTTNNCLVAVAGGVLRDYQPGAVWGRVAIAAKPQTQRAAAAGPHCIADDAERPDDQGE